MYLGSWKIDDVLTFTVNTHTPSTGAVTDADAVPTYRVYEDETGTPILTGSTAKLDDAGTTGYYSEQITLSAANGLEKGKTYTIRMSATVGGVTGAMSHTFQMEAEVDANVVSDKTGFSLAADQSAVTVGTVTLVTTTTTNTDMRGTDSAALATTALINTTWTDAKAAFIDHSIATVDTNVDTLLTRITAAVALASVCTETRLAELDAANMPSDLDNTYASTVGNFTILSSGTYGNSALKALIDTIDGIVDNILADTGTDGVLLAATATSEQFVDDVWDELLTGTTHNIVNSAGRRVREIGAFAIHSGTAQAGASNSITLAATANGGDGVYNRNLIVLTDNTGKGQTRTIVDYDNTTKVVVIDRDWRITPDNTTAYQIVPDNTTLVVDHGVAQAGSTSTTIKLRTYASDINDNYLCNIVVIVAGTGRGQARLVGSYDGTTKVVTICGDNWVVTPDATSIYVMMPYGTTCTSCIGTDALALINTECDTALTDYDPPTRTEATADKDAIITEVDANETKIDALNDITVADIKAGIADGTYDLEEMMRLIFSSCCAKVSGGGTTTITFRDGPDSKDRITETVDSDGNRTSVTLDGT